jgi:hypothetical protein
MRLEGEMRRFGDSSTFSVYKVLFSVDKKQLRLRFWLWMKSRLPPDFSTSHLIFLLVVSRNLRKSYPHVFEICQGAIARVLAGDDFFIHKLPTWWATCGWARVDKYLKCDFSCLSVSKMIH